MGSEMCIRDSLNSRLPNNLPGVTQWSGWSPPAQDFDEADGVFDAEHATDRSEILYQNLSNIDIDGVSAIDLLGATSIGDTDGDGSPEILDGWGEPIFMEWQQERLQIDDPELNIWEPAGSFCGLSCEHATFGTTSLQLSFYCQPCLLYTSPSPRDLSTSRMPSSA